MMKFSIRIKFFVVLLAFSLGPIFISRGLMSRASGTIIEDTRERTRTELLGIMSAEFEYTATSLLTVLERGGQVMTLASQAVAAEVERALSEPAPAGTPLPYFAKDFDDPDLAPPDAARRQGYARRSMGNRQQFIRVSFESPTAHLAPGTELSAVQGPLRQLVRAAPMIRAIFSNMPPAPFWINVALESGVFMSYPGHGSLPAMFDARVQDWYLKARESDGGRWVHTVDPSTRFVANKVLHPIRDAAGRFLGAVSVDIPASAMLPESQLQARWQGEVKTFLVQRPKEEGEAGQGLPILVQLESDEGGRRHWMSGVEQEWLTFDDPVGYRVLLHALDTRKSGVVRIGYRGRSSVCAFASTEAYSFLVIAPMDVIAKLPDEVSASLRGLFNEMRDLSAIISGVMLLITGFIAWFGSRAITRPIFVMADAARRLARGDFSAHIFERSGDERDQLVETFNEMGPKLRELVQLNRDMELAQEVQRLLLPSSKPRLAGFDISGGITYCDRTGGDYYDFLPERGGQGTRLAVVIGDVSGHGAPSALVMAAARGQLHTLAGIDLTPEQRMDSINTVLARDLDGTGRFLTMFYLQLEADSPVVRWVRAGHDPAVRYSPASGEFDRLNGEGIPLGVLEEHRYRSQEAVLAEGEVLVLATDGVWEARNLDGEMFGKQRMLAIIRENAHKSAEGIRSAVMDAVEAFQGNGQEDDIAVVVVKKDAGGTVTRQSISFRMSNKEDCFKCFRPKVEEFCLEHGLHPKIVFHLTLVLDELVTNVKTYGYLDIDEHPIDVTLSLDGDLLTIRVEDDAEPFNILEAPVPELDVPLENRLKPVGGMGIHLIRSMVHDIEYRREDGRNVLILSKNISKTHCPVADQ